MNGLKDRRSVWSQPELQELARSFVPAADEVGLLHGSRTAECQFFRHFCEQGHFGSRPAGETRQGIYAVTPGARLLASTGSTEPEKVAAMLRRALQAWNALPEDQRRMGPGMKRLLGLVPRWQGLFPQGGLILQVHSRDLEVAEHTRPDRVQGWTRDHAWFTRDEARAFVPDRRAPGAVQPVPAPLVRRLVRCHLVDQVQGQTWPMPDDSIEKAELVSEVVRADDDAVEIRMTGRTRAVQRGTWLIKGLEDKASAHEQGVETELLGRAVWDLGAQEFRTFDLVALGTRWGGTTHNLRRQHLAPSAIGFVLEIDRDASSRRIAPSLLAAYGWHLPPRRR